MTNRTLRRTVALVAQSVPYSTIPRVWMPVSLSAAPWEEERKIQPVRVDGQTYSNRRYTGRYVREELPAR